MLLLFRVGRKKKSIVRICVLMKLHLMNTISNGEKKKKHNGNVRKNAKIFYNPKAVPNKPIRQPDILSFIAALTKARILTLCHCS